VSVLQIILALLFAATCTYTVVGYPHRYGALSGRSRLFRTVGLFLLNLLLGLVLLITFIDYEGAPPAGVSRRALAIRYLSYVLACIFLVFSLLCVALLDWLELQVIYRRAQRDIVHKIPDDKPSVKMPPPPPGDRDEGEPPGGRGGAAP